MNKAYYITSFEKNLSNLLLHKLYRIYLKEYFTYDDLTIDNIVGFIFPIKKQLNNLKLKDLEQIIIFHKMNRTIYYNKGDMILFLNHIRCGVNVEKYNFSYYFIPSCLDDDYYAHKYIIDIFILNLKHFFSIVKLKIK